MYKISISFFAIISFQLLFCGTKQSKVRQAIVAVKEIGKNIRSPLFKQIGNTIKKPIIKSFGNTIKNSVDVFHRNKNTIRNLACGLQEKYLKIRHKFGNKPVKYLGEEGIRKLKYITSYAVGGSKQLVRTNDKKSIYMRAAAQMSGKEVIPLVKRSAEQVKGKELGSLINMVSKSKPLLPLIFVAGGLNRVTQFNVNPMYDDNFDDEILDDDNYDEKIIQDDMDDGLDDEFDDLFKDDDQDTGGYNNEYVPNEIEDYEQYNGQNKEELEQTQYHMQNNLIGLKGKNTIIEEQTQTNLENEDEIEKVNKPKIVKTKESISAQQKEYRNKNKATASEYQKKYHQAHKQTAAEKQKEYRIKNKERLALKQKEYREKNKLKLKDLRKHYLNEVKNKVPTNQKEDLERKEARSQYMKEYNMKNKEKLQEKRRDYDKEHADKIIEFKKKYYTDNRDQIVEKQKEWRENNKGKITAYMKEYNEKLRKELKELKRIEAENPYKTDDFWNKKIERILSKLPQANTDYEIKD